MFRTIKDFTDAFKYESESTLKVFKHISNEALAHKPHADVRSMQRLVWHITITLGEMLGKAGLTIDCPDEHSKPLNDMEEIYKVYEKASKSVLNEVAKNWKDSDLTDEVSMYGENWAKGTILTVLIKHEAHHRGQLTILMRFSGLTVPGIYGPSKEEWTVFDVPSPE